MLDILLIGAAVTAPFIIWWKSRGETASAGSELVMLEELQARNIGLEHSLSEAQLQNRKFRIISFVAVGGLIATLAVLTYYRSLRVAFSLLYLNKCSCVAS